MVISKNLNTRADLSEIGRPLGLLCQPGEVYEVRAFGKGTTSGYFNDLDKLA